MFRHGTISTETDRAPFFFTLAAFVCCLTAAVLLVVLSGGHALAIFACILLGIVGVASGCVLFAMVTDQAYIRDGELTIRYLFRKTRVPLGQIGRVEQHEDLIYVYDCNENRLGTVNARLTGVGNVLHELDKNGVRFT